MPGFCRRLALFSAFWLSLTLFAAAPASAATVLAIDYGADFMKASLMKPGLPFDVLLNKDSKRKIQSSVAWKGEERLFGQDAYNLATRFPKDTYNSLKYLLGVPANADVVSYYTSIASPALIHSSRYTVAVPQPGGRSWDIEELVAMQLAYVRQLATDAAGEPVRDVVVSVPPFYTQFERDAIADAVEIAGMKLLTLVNDGTAVAINYAMTRTFTEPEHHIIFDSGASATRATLFTLAPDAKGRGTQVQVLGVGFDRLLGGTELTRRLREILISDFMKKNGGLAIREDKRAMARLWKEADRVKAILSANTEATAAVESLIDDVDFKTKLTRAQFEAACKDIKGTFAQSVHGALANTNLTMKDIKSVILFGGNTRVPMVRQNLESVVGSDKIAVNVNADEAAVLGAALHGASLSRQFRTKDIKVTDVIPYDVQVAYEAEAKSSGPGVRPRTIHSHAFAAGSKTGTRKTLSFKRHADFNLNFQYKEAPAPQLPVEFLEAKIEGVTEALANITASGGIEPIIKATIALSESGFVSVPEAFAYADIKDESISGMLKGIFGDKSDKASAESSEAGENTKESVPKTPKSITIPLKVPIKYTSVAPMSLDSKREARKRLNEMEAAELAISMREEQRNALEGYIYRIRDILDGDDDHPFMQCSQASERTALKKKLDEVSNWFHDHSDSAETRDFVEKRVSMQAIENPVQHRYQEIKDFPDVLNNSQKWNFHTRMFIAEARQNLTEEAKSGEQGRYTKEELDDLETTLKDHESWLHVNVEKQKLVKHNEDPAIETKEMLERADKLEQHLKRLVQKKPPRRKPTTTSSSTSTSAAPAASSAPASGEGKDKVSPHEEL